MTPLSGLGGSVPSLSPEPTCSPELLSSEISLPRWPAAPLVLSDPHLWRETRTSPHRDATSAADGGCSASVLAVLVPRSGSTQALISSLSPRAPSPAPKAPNEPKHASPRIFQKHRNAVGGIGHPHFALLGPEHCLLLPPLLSEAWAPALFKVTWVTSEQVHFSTTPGTQMLLGVWRSSSGQCSPCGWNLLHGPD